MNKLIPHLWYVDQAQEAAEFYVSIFPDSRIDRVTSMPSESPSGPAGSVDVVEFTLFGQAFMAISAGQLDEFNHSVSFLIRCDDQEEIDRYWDALVDSGGTAEPCGWVRDKYGLSWQVAPAMMEDLMADPDREKARRATDAMLSMQKIDLATIQAAFDGEPVRSN